MYTQLESSLADTRAGQEARALIRNCVHCGFCLATCPTYLVLGDERDGPRGRIYLIKQLVEGESASDTTRRHLDRCLTCRSCETTCPSGVEYARLLDIGRALVEERVGRPWPQRALRFALAATLSRRRLFAGMLRGARWLAPLLSESLRERIPMRQSAVWPAVRHARRMIVLEGCVQPSLAPAINAAAARTLDRLGISLIRLGDEGCCGALNHHLGHTGLALGQARRNVDVCHAALEAGAETIVSTASGCGVMVKDYAQLLRDDPRYAQRARAVSEATRDLCEVIDPAALSRLVGDNGEAGAVAWQSPCTLQHGQKLSGRVEALLSACGYRLTPVADAHLCCGSAGTYSILERDLSLELRARKLATLAAGHPGAIATANIGCLEHLRPATDLPVAHWIELVDAALPSA